MSNFLAIKENVYCPLCGNKMGGCTPGGNQTKEFNDGVRENAVGATLRRKEVLDYLHKGHEADFISECHNCKIGVEFTVSFPSTCEINEQEPWFILGKQHYWDYKRKQITQNNPTATDSSPTTLNH